MKLVRFVRWELPKECVHGRGTKLAAAKYRRVVLNISGEGFVHPGERVPVII